MIPGIIFRGNIQHTPADENESTTHIKQCENLHDRNEFHHKIHNENHIQIIILPTFDMHKQRNNFSFCALKSMSIKNQYNIKNSTDRKPKDN